MEGSPTKSMADGDTDDEFTEEDENKVFEGMNQTFRLIMDAKHGTLNTPVDIEIGFTGEKAEAMGSARHIADVVSECGYETTTEHLEETAPIPGTDERQNMRIVVKAD